MILKSVTINNRDATPKKTTFVCSEESFDTIMGWYEAYASGDRFTVHVQKLETVE